jgi:DNA-binding Lrp family transcriptional regulator
LWVGDRAYSDLMKELWGSPGVWNVRKRYVDVARKLGVDEETIRNRIKYLKDSGFLTGWRVVPSPAQLDRRLLFLLLALEDQNSKEDAISRLKEKEGVIAIVSIYNNNLLVNLMDDQKRKASNDIFQMGFKVAPLTVPAMNVPSGNFRMSTTDWKIVKLLLKDAEKNVNDVAREIKVSAKTVKRRLGAMMSASAILIMPMVNLRKSNGVSYNLMIQSQEGRKDEVDKLVTSKISNLVFTASSSKDGSIFGFTGSNISEGNDLLKWVRQLNHVKSAQLNISEEVFYIFDWLEREVASRSEELVPKESTFAS